MKLFTSVLILFGFIDISYAAQLVGDQPFRESIGEHVANELNSTGMTFGQGCEVGYYFSYIYLNRNTFGIIFWQLNDSLKQEIRKSALMVAKENVKAAASTRNIENVRFKIIDGYEKHPEMKEKHRSGCQLHMMTKQ